MGLFDIWFALQDSSLPTREQNKLAQKALWIPAGLLVIVLAVLFRAVFIFIAIAVFALAVLWYMTKK